MKKYTLVVAGLCMVIGLIVVPAYAQRGGVQAKVPFNFVVSDKSFPAGEYTMIVKTHELKIEDADGKIVAMVLANQVSLMSLGRARGLWDFQGSPGHPPPYSDALSRSRAETESGSVRFAPAALKRRRSGLLSVYIAPTPSR